ncbi:hypothetical protein SDJN03_06907, partial [Cucurbita argyrosperma subsp. sororia]
MIERAEAQNRSPRHYLSLCLVTDRDVGFGLATSYRPSLYYLSLTSSGIRGLTSFTSASHSHNLSLSDFSLDSPSRDAAKLWSRLSSPLLSSPSLNLNLDLSSSLALHSRSLDISDSTLSG